MIFVDDDRRMKSPMGDLGVPRYGVGGGSNLSWLIASLTCIEKGDDPIQWLLAFCVSGERNVLLEDYLLYLELL